MGLFAQRTALLEINNLKAEICDNGGLFQNYNTQNRLTVKNTGNQSIMYEAQLWFAANSANSTYTAIQQEYTPQSLNGATSDFSAGPISANYSNPNYDLRYQRIWQLRRDDIEFHLDHFQDPNYNAHSSIRDWPAHGDTANGEAYMLAPFIDANANGIYEPEMGDYPMIRGDEALYIIYNDDNRLNPNTDTNSLGLEIHLMVYAYDDLKTYHLNNSIFFYYRIINRSNRTYENFHSNFFEGITLGSPNEDLIGSDSSRSMIYTYNRDTIDPGWGGFGAYPGAVAIFDPEAYANRAMYYNNLIPNLDTNAMWPKNKSDYYNYAQGKWRDGSPLRLDNPSGLFDTANGSGYQKTAPFGPISNWAFNDQSDWYNSPNQQYIQAMLLARDDAQFAPGDSLCWNLIVAYANDSSDANPYAPLLRLKSKVDSLSHFFQTKSFDCQTYKIGLNEKVTLAQIQVYPQPAQGYLQIEAPYPLQKVELYRLDGQKCLSLEGNQKQVQINCAGLAPGIYILRMESKGGESQTKKILIQ